MNNIDLQSNIRGMSPLIISNKAHMDVEKAVEMTKSAKTLAVNSDIRPNAGINRGTLEGGQAIHHLGAVPKKILNQYKALIDSQRIDEALSEIEENEREEVNSNQNNKILEKKKVSSDTEVSHEDEDSEFTMIYGAETSMIYGEEKQFTPQPIVLKENCINMNEGDPPFKAFGKMLQATHRDNSNDHFGNEVTYFQLGKGMFKVTDRAEITMDNKIYNLAISDFNIKGDAKKKGIDGKGIDLDKIDITNRTHELNMVNLIFSKRLENVIPGGTLLNKETGHATIVTKYCNLGTLDNAWSRTSSAQKKSLLINIAVGKKALNDAGIVHGDFHGGNILVHEKKKNQNVIAYINDFGTSKEIEKPQSGIIQNLALYSTYKKIRSTELLHESKGLEVEKEELHKAGKDVKELENKLKTLKDELNRIITNPAEDSYALGLELCRLARKGNQEVEFAPLEPSMFTWINKKIDDPIEVQKKIENFVNVSFGKESNGKEKLKTLAMKLVAYDPKDRPDNDTLIKMLEEIDLSEIERMWPSV